MTSILESLYNNGKDIETSFELVYSVIEEVGEGKEGRYSNCSF